MVILTYILAILVGITMGLFGGGGSILTIPILIYVANVEPIQATSYSIVIVGLSAIFGSANKFRKNEIDLSKGIYFGIPSIIMLYLTRRYIIDLIPNTLASVGEFDLTKQNFILLIFTLIMLLSAYTMFFDTRIEHIQKEKHPLYIVALGVLIGLIVGLVGAGGGFLFIPALVKFTGMKMKEAIGSSLFIVALNSIFGFMGDIANDVRYDISFLTIFAVISIIGMFFGIYISNYFSGRMLKRYFAILVFLIAVSMILKEVFFIK